MILKRLSVLNYKNISEAKADFSSKINCFFGNNGMGKTNLLDAIYYLSFCKSHNIGTDSLVINKDADMCVLEGDYELDEREERIFCAIRRGQRKVMKRGGKEYDKLSEHIGLLPLVMVSPADSELIRGGSDERRRFVDLIISQSDKQYLHALIQYNRTLIHRNALLKEHKGDASLFEVLDMQLDMYGATIFEKRKALVKEFVPIFNTYYNYISGTDEPVDLVYSSSLEERSLLETLAASRERDAFLGYTSAGVHKDDLEMTLDGNLIRKVGSQGQNKTYLIALKLAQYMFLKEKGGTVPILLLDDIFDKLDANRVERIVSLTSGDRFGQTFITDTNRKYLDDIVRDLNYDYSLFRVDNGRVEMLV
jgi:DNA replication and repair protein RecF